MVTVDDIATVVEARCDATFEETVTGGAYFLRADQDASVPYAVFTIERSGDPDFSSDGSYLQKWALRMVAYSDQGVDNPNNIQLAIATAINTNPTSWTALRDGAVVHCLPRGYDGKFAPELRQARDVFVAGAQWEMLISGNAIS